MEKCISQFDPQVLVSKLLTYFSSWLDKDLEHNGQENFVFPKIACKWIYSLLLVLEYPLLDDGASTLSKLLYFCCVVRSQPHDQTTVAEANVIYTVITKFFGQQETHY